MNVEELVGYHILTGVDRDVFHNCGYFNDTDANVIVFELDGISYIAKEDPDDGYRSYCEDLEVYNKKPKNTFPAVQVECVHIERSEYGGECDILEFVDCKNNKVILRIGTDYLDDYYPCCVFEWHPENMDINKNVKIKDENSNREDEMHAMRATILGIVQYTLMSLSYDKLCEWYKTAVGQNRKENNNA